MQLFMKMGAAGAKIKNSKLVWLSVCELLP